MASFKEARDKKKKKAFKRWKSHLYRYLGGRVHMAYGCYRCNRCVFLIEAGDLYRRDKYVNALGFHTKRTHWPECHGPTEEEDRKIRDHIEREREAEKPAERRAA